MTGLMPCDVFAFRIVQHVFSALQTSLLSTKIQLMKLPNSDCASGAPPVAAAIPSPGRCSTRMRRCSVRLRHDDSFRFDDVAGAVDDTETDGALTRLPSVSRSRLSRGR